MKRNGKAQARRAIGRDYLAALNAAVPLDVWTSICKRAADDALAGDPKAREWLSKRLLGAEAHQLTVLAAEEADTNAEAASENEIANRRQKLDDDRKRAEFNRMLDPAIHL